MAIAVQRGGPGANNERWLVRFRTSMMEVSAGTLVLRYVLLTRPCRQSSAPKASSDWQDHSTSSIWANVRPYDRIACTLRQCLCDISASMRAELQIFHKKSS